MHAEPLTILLTPEERANLDAKAERLGLDGSDLMRLALDSFDVDETERFLTAMAVQLETSVERMNRSLDETHEFVQRNLAEMRAERAAAEAERRRAA